MRTEAFTGDPPGFKGTLPSLPETNSHGKPTYVNHEFTKKPKNSKTLKTLDLGVSLQGTTMERREFV
jgi:hypothetical protein